MSILIKPVERKNPQNREQSKFFPAVATRGESDLDKLSELMSVASSLSRGDIYSTLLNVVDTIPNELLDGKIVKLGKLGSLYLNLDSDGVDSADKVTGATVKSVHVVFRPSKELNDKLQNFSIRTT